MADKDWKSFLLVMFGMELKLPRWPTKTGKVLYNVQIKGQCISLILVSVNYWKVLKMVRENMERIFRF